MKKKFHQKKSGYDWKYCSIGGTARVNITSGEDIAHLGELDQKLWTVLSCPVEGLEFDATTLKIMDSDADGKIRLHEIIAASNYLVSVLKNSDDILKSESGISLDAINPDTAEGKALLDAAAIVLSHNSEAERINFDDAAACRASYNAHCKALADEATAKQKETAKPYGDATDAVVAAVSALKAKVADFYTRCSLIAFNDASAATLDSSTDKIAAISAQDLNACAAEIAALPLAHPTKEGILPFDGINPSWKSTFAAIRDAATADFPDAKGLDAAQWGAIVAKVEAYSAAISACSAQANAAATAATAGMEAALATVDKFLHIYRDFYHLLRNYLTLNDFYSPSDLAVFQAGKLYIDQRCCDLCIKVSDMGKHSDMAGLSGMYLIYCACKSKTLCKEMNIAAVLTDGDVDGLRVGKNAVFYDRAGNDWDATVTKIIDNPISIRQAFWSPYKKFASWIAEKIGKAAADKESKSDEMLKGIELKPAEGGSTPAAPAFDIAKFAGIFAAIGMAVGYIGQILAKGFEWFAAQWYNLPVGICLIILFISGPSMFIAWSKLRKRDLGPVLNANGWAINAKALVNAKFGATLTSLAKFPLLLDANDPYAKKKTPCWVKIIVWLLVIAAVAVAVVYFTGLWEKIF